MKIGILTREIISQRNVKINGIPFTYLDIINKDYYPIFIDSSLSIDSHKEEILKQIKDLKGFIIPGGSEVSEIDMFIIDYCYKFDIPLLGICLGMQEIGLYFNKKGLKKMNNLSHFDLQAEYLHPITLNKKGYLYSLLNKETIPVNSRHKYHLTENKNYLVEAKCDNIIEAIKVKHKKYILGVQFHPEIMYYYDSNAKIIFDDFLKQINL